MTATILDGRALAQELRSAAKAAIAEHATSAGITPGLAVVQVEGDAASTRYVRSLEKLCTNVGANFFLYLLPEDVDQARLEATIETINQDARIDGLLIQLPLPAHLDAQSAILRIDHRKDIDGVHPINAGLLAQGRPAFVPNTPAGGMALLERYQIDPRGKRAAVVGRSAIVGRPMTQLLIQADATVTVCHSRTTDLGAVLRECDIIAVAAGRPGLITADMVRPGATIIDFGTNVTSEGKLVGDVDFESVSLIAGAITPVPGGTGPVTNAVLIGNLIAAARRLR
jgi:methylenetetrahydrofolate dehydrogenase (NADP+)/methenyltetrahydrofolate cyclohydrolase